MAVKQQNVMPLSLAIRDESWLKQHPHPGLSFVLAQDDAGRPVVEALIEDDQGQSVEITCDASQLDALVEELKEIQCAVQWQMAQCHWQFVRYSPRSKWHLRLKQWHGGHLCTYTLKSREREALEEVIPAGITLWNGTVCRACVQRWTEQILSGWIRYQFASQPFPPIAFTSPVITRTSGKEGDEI